jgi:integrase
MIDIFHYEQETFAIDLIARNFKVVFQKAYHREKILFLEIYKCSEESLLEYVTSLADVKEPVNTVLKHVSSEYLKSSKRFDKFYIVNMYYKLPLQHKISKHIASIILRFHIACYKDTANNIQSDLSAKVRYFVHLVEILQSQYIQTKNELPIEELLKKIFNNELSLVDSIEKEKCDYAYQYMDEINYIKSHIVVKNMSLLNDLSAFKEFFTIGNIQINKRHSSYTDTTEKNKQYVEDDYYITKVKKNLEPLSLEDRYEEDNALKEQIQVKIAKKKNTKSLQNKKILSISAAIAKSKLQLPSLYKIPSAGSLASFCNYLIHSVENKEQILDEKNKYAIAIFIIAIIMGIKPSIVVELFFSKDKYDVDDNTIEIEVSAEHFAKYKQFDEEMGVRTINKIRYKIPFELVHLVDATRRFDPIVFDEKDFPKRIQLFAKKFGKTIKLNFNNLFSSSLIHRKLVYSNINTEILLATQNIDQNLTPTLAYTATSTNASEYSNWLNEYMVILGLKEPLQKYLFGKSFNQAVLFDFSQKTELLGSRKLIKKESFIDFLREIELLREERRLDKYAKFNIYSIYVRYTLSLLLGTRDFSISVDLDRISWKNNIIVIKEKGKYKNSGYRMVPLTSLAKQILQNYLKALEKLKISEKRIILLDNDKVLPSTISNIKKVFQKFSFFEKHQNLYKKLDAVPLNLGRHLITSMVTAAGASRDDLNAYMGHGVNGGEVLGMYSFHNAKMYREKFELIINEVADIYNLKDIYRDIRL